VVTNTGDTTGSYEAAIRVDGEPRASTKITLDGGASEPVVVNTVKNAPKSYEVSIGGLSGTFVVATPANFALGSLSASPAVVVSGEQITISARVANTGDLRGVHQVTLRIDNRVVDTKEVSLAGGTSQRVSFTTTRDAAGICSVNVNRLEGSFIAAEVETSSETLPQTNWWLIGSLVFAGTVWIMAILVTIIRRVRI
jgi:hypothetical protein